VPTPTALAQSPAGRMASTDAANSPMPVPAAAPAPVPVPVPVPAPKAAVPQFSIFEIGAPAGPLGLVLFLHTIQLAMGPGRTLSVYCCIVRESKSAAAIQAGDVLMSVGDYTLLVDEFQAPLGRGVVEACVKVLTTAANPRRLRFYRSESVDAAGDVTSLSVAEAEAVAPEIFNTGDGSKRLLEVLEVVSLTAPVPAAPAAPAVPASAPLPTPAPTTTVPSLGGVSSPSSPGGAPKKLNSAFAPPAGFERQHGVSAPFGFNAGDGTKAGVGAGAGTIKALGTSAVNGDEVLTGAERRRRMQQKSDATTKVLEHMFRDVKPGKPTGLDIVPVMLGLDGGKRGQVVLWAGMVVANRSEAQRVIPGDVIVFVGGSLCVAEAKQVRNGMEFVRALRELVSSAPAPRAIRFLRLTDTELDAGEEPLPYYQLNAEDTAVVSNNAFSGDNDRGRTLGALLAQAVAAATADEATQPLVAKQRAQREAIEAKVLHDVEQGNLPRRLRAAKTSDAAAGPPSGPKTALIHEVVFRNSGPLPLAAVIEPMSITFETLPGEWQTFWCAVVNGTWQNIKAGDVVLYVNTHMCMVDRSQARNGFEFILALKEVLESASIPRAVRFIRLGRSASPTPHPCGVAHIQVHSFH
jgi:hypothetical protein